MLRPSLSPIAVLSVLFTVLLWAPRTQAEAPPAPESLRRHLVPQADLGQTLDWSEPMEFVPVAQVEELLKKRHDKAMDDFRRSRDAEKRSSELLPVTHLVRSASVQTRARAGSGWCQGELELEVEAIQPDDTLVAVLGGEVIVGSASVDGAPARISVSGGPAVSQNAPVAANAPAQAQQIQQSLNQMAQQSQTPAGAPRTVEVAIRGSGRHRLLVSFAARVTEEEFYSVVRFSLPGVPAAHLSATVPGKQVSASILPPCKLATRAGEAPATTLLEADLPPSPEVVLRWVEVADAGAAPAPAPESNATTGPGFASRVDATILHAYDAGEKGLAGEVTAWLRVRRAPISQLELHVPAGVKTLALVGPRNWTLQDPGPAGKARSARLLLPEKFTGDVQLKLDFTLDTRPSGFDTELAAFTLAGLARQPGFVAVTRSANLQLACSAPAGVDAVSAADLPAAIRPSLEGEELLFLYRRPDPALAPRLKGTRFPDAAVLAAVVDEARAWTLCESTGQIVGRVAYRFRSSGRESLTLDLAGFERTGLFLDGRTPAASQSGKSGVQVSLADVRAGQPSVLELRFRGAIPPLGPSGRVRLELPAIDVPVRELAWDVYTPRDFAFTPFEGIEGVRRGVAQPSDLLHPPDPSWPSAPQQMRALGLAAGARPAARSEYLASLLALYPLLMLFLFGGFVAHALKRLLIDGRGFAAATAAAGLGVFLAVAYIPYYQGGVAATLAGLTVHVVVMLGTALVRWGAGRGRAAAAGAAVLVLLAAAPESGAAGGGSPHERLLPRSDLLDRVKEAGRAQNENYLREKLARNRLQLQSEQQQNAAPPPAAQPRPAAREEGQAGADVDSVAPAPQSVAPAQSTVQILRGLNRKAPAPPAEPVAANAVQINEVPPTPPPRPAAYDIYIPYTGSPLSPREGTRGFFRKAQLDLLRSSLEVPKPPEAGSELHLLSAGYVLELAGGRATGSLSAALEATGSGWKELSIDIQPGSVTGWTIDGKPVAGQQALLERREGACVLRTVLAGRHSLEVRLSAPIVGTLQEGRLALGHVPEAPTRVVLRGVDPGCELLAAGPVAQIADGFELCLEPTAALSAGWRPKTVLPGGAAVTAPDDQERFSAESFAILSPAGGALGLRCRARLTIGEAGVRTVAFRLPEGFEFL
ncbi:MAG: hypothetical protein HY303_17375 [Candidatus Wallbacteria bacterium]|nr:hypothetical protein [Candidatus Wallbacteria bacterium]